MVEKIYITPGNVRGLGNIVSTKTASDFTGNYANIIQTSTGDFILSYEGLLLKFNTSIASTIKDTTAYLYCTVLLEEDNSPVEDLTVTCTFEDATVLTETTDSEGEVTFTWTPTSLGEETVTINCSKQGDYASHTQTVDIRIGLLLNFYGIMTGLTCEDDEYYEGTFETNIEHRSQLSTYIKDIFVADGGERCVAQDGLVYIADPGDLVVTYDNLDQDADYSQVIFEGEVDSLVGAVYGMSINSNDEIILTRLEREDIVGDGPVVESVGLTSSSSSVYMSGSLTLTATVLGEDDEPLEDVSVAFLEDGSSKGSSVTNSSGVATFTYSPSSTGSHTLTAKAGGVVSTGVSVTATKATPSFGQFTVSPTSCLVNDTVSVSGVLAVYGSRPVKIYDGDTLLTTVYTDSSHAFSASVSSLSAGSHSIKAVFVEDDWYQGNETSSVSVTVSKRSATLSLSSSKASVEVGESFTLSGTLSVGSGQSLLLYRDDHYLETLTTGTNGAFSKSLSEASSGTVSYYVLFESTSVYSRVQSSTVSVSVGSTPTVDSVSLTGDKSILSYADSESATLSATVLDSNDDPMEGVTVTFYNGLTSMGTADTNSSGVATKSYASSGVGDVSFTAVVGTISSETYSIQDCIFYDSLTSDRSLFTLVQGTASMVYSSNGLKYTGTSNTDCIHKWNRDLPDGSYTFECDVTDISSSGYSSGIGTEDAQILKGNSGLYARYISKSGDFFNNGNASTPFHLLIEVTGSTSKTIKYYRDDTLLGTGNNVSRNKQFVLRSYNNRMIQIKDLKIKPL